MAKLGERHVFAIRETVDNVLGRRSPKLHHHVADLIGKAWITDECAKNRMTPTRCGFALSSRSRA